MHIAGRALLSAPPNTPLHLTAAGFGMAAPLVPSRFVVVCSRGRK